MLIVIKDVARQFDAQSVANMMIGHTRASSDILNTDAKCKFALSSSHLSFCFPSFRIRIKCDSTDLRMGTAAGQ